MMPKMDFLSLAAVFTSTFLTVFVSGFMFRKLAVRYNILDEPSHRKVHKKAVPLLGGLSVYAGVLCGFGFNTEYLRFLMAILAGGTVVLMVSLIDDIRGLSAYKRLFGQLLATGIILLFGVRVSFLPDNLWGNFWEIMLTLLWVVGITNAMNYLDGIDGLSSGLTAICSFFFSVIAYRAGQLEIALAGFVVMASCLGFLPHNLRKKKMFLGDTGSTFLGFMLAALALRGNWAEDSMVKLTIPVLILGVPIFDMVFTTIMRIKEGKIRNIVEWLEYGGKDHFHHRLIDMGLYSTGSLLFICFINISLGISALLVSNENGWIGAMSVIQAFIIFAGIGVLMVMGNKSGRCRD